MSRAQGDMNQTVISDWKAKLPTLIQGYEPKNVYNMDECGLFYKQTKHTTCKGTGCTGGKQSKQRATIALCARMTAC